MILQKSDIVCFKSNTIQILKKARLVDMILYTNHINIGCDFFQSYKKFSL